MRQTLRNLGLLAGLLAIGTPLAAEPVVGGYVLDRLPGGKPVVTDGKSVVLAHVFNPDQNTIRAGSFDVGVEVQGPKGVKTFVLRPNGDLVGGAMKTFRLRVPLNDASKAGMVRVFARLGGRKIWSDALGGANTATRKHADGTAVTTLFTEAPPEPAAGTPPTEVPFENDVVSAAKPRTAPKPAAKTGLTPATAPAVTAKPAKPAAPAVAPAAVQAPAATTAAKPRVINPNEFKTLRTIDEELVIYVVKAGDTLQTVAERYYGSADHVRTIADLNFIEARAAVKPGEEIIVDVRPLSGSKTAAGKKESVKAPAAPAAVSPSIADAQGGRRYTVQDGDTLAIIAKRFYGKATKAGLLMKANPGLNPKNLKIGTELVIPAEAGDKA
ncbi:MAG TPA: LysM domain-containing protein [Candidatus Ozemobacteraceae bacterium]|nr:LysM domain-containing protein [Candidatus Ozemobacteraceae bacterium]